MTIFGIDVGSIFSSFIDSGDPAAALANAQLQTEAQVGKFLTTGQRISDAKRTIDSMRSSPNVTVAQRAVTLSANASALLDTYTAIKSDATALINKMIDLKAQVNADPQKFADVSGQTNYGTRLVDVLSANKNQVLQAASDSVALINRIDGYTTQVEGLESDTQSLANLAQGKGVAGALSSLSDTYSTAVKDAAMVGAGALAIYFLVPKLLPKLLAKSKR